MPAIASRSDRLTPTQYRKPFSSIISACLTALFALGFTACGLFEPTIGGELKPGDWNFQAQSYAVGPYTAAWQGDALDSATLTVHNSAAPDRELWATLPGLAFVSAARGQETIHEARGMFTIDDETLQSCSDQKINSVEHGPNNLTIAGELDCRGSAVPYSLTFAATGDGHLRFELAVDAEGYNRSYLIYASHAGEGFYGFGEQFTYFDVKGRKLPIFVMEQGIGRGAEPITTGADLTAGAGGKWHTSYAGVPHYITSDLNSLFLENYEYTSFDMRDAERVTVEAFSGKMTGRILYGETPLQLIEEFTEYSGRMRKLPDWIHDGAIIGMQGGTEKVQRVHGQLKALDTPIAAYWLQDWEGQRKTSFGKQLWWNWELDNDRYPGWDQLRAEFSREGIELMTYINPFLADVSEKENHRRNLFAEARDKDYLIKTQSGEPYMILNTSFSAGLIDLTNPAARAWIKEVIKSELVRDAGSKGWMADFGEALPYDAVLYSGESPATYHNKYPEEWQQVNREAINEVGLGNEVVFFSRSGYTKSPGLTTLFWLGDQLVSWDRYDGIKTAITGLLSSGLSGYSLNHSDIGGYTTITNPIADYHRPRELLWRWTELSAFNVVFRTHEGNQPDNNFQIYDDEETLKFFSRFAKIFAALTPYRKALVADAEAKGHPVVRHLFVHYPNDPEVRKINHEQFMMGPDFLIAPVLDPDRVRVRVYLPAGEWTHLWSGESVSLAEGEYRTVDAPLGKPAVYYKKDSAAGADLRASLESQDLL
ncbi:MAG: alpha-glucosidase [bacterium]|nr:alpha-glucosidase [bacterium]